MRNSSCLPIFQQSSLCINSKEKYCPIVVTQYWPVVLQRVLLCSARTVQQQILSLLTYLNYHTNLIVESLFYYVVLFNNKNFKKKSYCWINCCLCYYVLSNNKKLNKKSSCWIIVLLCSVNVQQQQQQQQQQTLFYYVVVV